MWSIAMLEVKLNLATWSHYSHTPALIVRLLYPVTPGRLIS